MEQKKAMYTEPFSSIVGNLKLQGYVVWPRREFVLAQLPNRGLNRFCDVPTIKKKRLDPQKQNCSQVFLCDKYIAQSGNRDLELGFWTKEWKKWKLDISKS